MSVGKEFYVVCDGCGDVLRSSEVGDVSLSLSQLIEAARQHGWHFNAITQEAACNTCKNNILAAIHKQVQKDET